MDPAFSLADELAELHRQQSSQAMDDELDFESHHAAYVGAALLEDELGAVGSLDAELERLHVQGHDLASELDCDSQLDPVFATAQKDEEGLQSYAYDRSASTMQGASSCSSASHAESSANATRAVDSPARTPGSCISIATTDISDTLASTQSFLMRLSTLSSSSTSAHASMDAAGINSVSAEVEDTAALETAAAKYLMLVSQCSMQREAQLRELRELDRKLERDTACLLPSTSSCYASDLSLTDLMDDDQRFSTSPTQRPLRRTTSSLSSDTTITTVPALSSDVLLDPALFAPLYTSTLSLVSSLNGLHEHAQVTKSSTADAARKLRTVKGLIAQWKGDVESAQVSELWIQQNQPSPKHHAELTDHVDRLTSKTWVTQQIEWCKNRIDQAEGRARILLTPVSITASS